MQIQPGIFTRILLPFCIGIWVLRQLEFAKLNSVALLFSIILFIALLIINYLYILLEVFHYKRQIAILINFFLFSFGGLCCSSYNNKTDSEYLSKQPAEYFLLAVDDEPQSHGSILRFKAKLLYSFHQHKKRKVTGNLMVAVRTDSLHPIAVQYGAVYLIPANYTTIEPPCNPAEFDFRFWLANHNIYHQCFLSRQQLIPTGTHKGSAIIGFALALRKRQIELYRNLIKNDEAFAVASTLILGYRADLDAQTLTAYSKTGTIHALSVSGMHVGIIYLVLNWSLGWMNRKQVLKWLKLIVILLLIWSYTLLTGYSASVLRSAIMLSMFILTKAFRKNTDSYHILCFSAFCLLFYNPFLLWDVGFQLSYMAVFGLIYLQPKIQGLISFRWIWMQKLWGLIAMSIAAQALTFPFSVYYFHLFPVYFILSNLFITLPVAILMYTGLILLIFRLYWLAPAFEWLITFMNNGLAKIAHLPYSSVDAVWLTKTELILLSLFFIFAALSAKSKKYIYCSLILLICLQGMLALDKIKAMQQRKIILFALKKNYAAAFISAKSALIITDLKPDDKAFKFHIQPALDQQKITNLICIPWHKKEWDTNQGKHLMNEIKGRNITELNGVTLHDHQLTFRNFKVLLIDTAFSQKRIEGKPTFDAVWLHNNPQLNLDELREDIRFKKIWIDATNKSYAVKNYQQDTINFKHSTVVLKKTAYLINLK